jgi:hypothetical protein
VGINKHREVNLKKILIFFYIIIPLFFYSIPVLIAYMTGELKTHFYTTEIFYINDAIKVLFGHLGLGLATLWVLKSTKYTIYLNHSSYALKGLVIFVFTISIFSSGILAMLFMALFVILIGNFKFSNTTYLILLLLAISNLFLFQERIYVVLVMLSWYIGFLSRQKIAHLFLYGVIGILMLVYVLHPLKYGELPFSNFQNFSYIFQHLQPIYHSAFISSTLNFPLIDLLVEFIPFGKSLSGGVGVVEIVALEALPFEIIEEGGRIGSNSSMYFSGTGVIIVLVMLFIIKMSLMSRLNVFTNSILIYFVIFGPYFIRRTFASFTIDIIVVTLCLILFSFIIFILKR